MEVNVTSQALPGVPRPRVTMSATLTGFVLGTGLGILIAIGIVPRAHELGLDRSLMPVGDRLADHPDPWRWRR